MSSDETDTSTLHQTMLDFLDEALKESSDIPSEVRQSTLQQFDEAMQEAQDHPKPPEEVLAEWQQTTSDLQSRIDTMRENGDISATDAADMLNPYDEITQKLKGLIEASAGDDEAAGGTGLPRGVPPEVAATLKSSGS